MIAVDARPFTLGPPSVAQALTALLAGWQRIETRMPLRALEATDRRALPALVADARAEAFLSPWSSFPRLGVPVVALVHELPFVRGVSEGRLRDWKHRRWLRRNVRACAAIVVPTAATRDDVIALHPEARERVHVVPHGFDPEPWAAAERAPAEPPYAVMVGVGATRRMALKKGLDVALEAWRARLVPEGLRLVLVGQSAFALPTGVEARPDLDAPALRQLVAGARLLLYPSRSEGFGYPPLEALAAGVPVVASDIPAVVEVTGEGAVRVPPGDAPALAAGIRTLLDDEATHAACLAAGRERIAALTPERAALGIRDVFRTIGVDA